ncbi:MAG: helix-turn-helix transcriptional regulator [Cyanobacteria bacterium P01_D01_bin.115]
MYATWHTFTPLKTSDTIRGMGKAGKVLKQVLEEYGISQNGLATTLGTERGTVYRWVHELRDPSAETLVAITNALRKLNPDAAQTFVQRYLGDVAQGKGPSE